MNELKPCPLCGNEVYIDREDIFCDYCHLVLRFNDYIYTGEAKNLEEARKMGIDAWNSRVDDSTEIVYTCRPDKFKQIKSAVIKEFTKKLKKRLKKRTEYDEGGWDVDLFTVTEEDIDNIMKEFTE